MVRGVMSVLTTAALAVVAAEAYADDTADLSFKHVSCKGAPNEIRIIIRNVKKSVGLMTADLYNNDPDGFLQRAGRVNQVRFAAKAPVTAFCIDAPAPNSYAIAVYQDKNANKTFDKNALGLPAEPYGVSNNPPMRFAPPKLADSLFDVDAGGATVEIDLKN